MIKNIGYEDIVLGKKGMYEMVPKKGIDYYAKVYVERHNKYGFSIVKSVRSHLGRSPGILVYSKVNDSDETYMSSWHCLTKEVDLILKDSTISPLKVDLEEIEKEINLLGL